MKKQLKAVVAAGVLAAAAVARGDIGLGVVGGYWNAGDVADEMTGFGGASLRVEADLLPVFGVEARFGAWGMSDDFDGRAPDGEWREWEFEATVASAEAGLVGKIPLGPVTLFGGGGVGAYFPDGEIEGWTGWRVRERLEWDSDPEVGEYAFGGLELALAPNVAVVGEVRYTWLEIEAGIEGHGWRLSDTAELDLSGFGVEIGLMLWL